MDVLVVCGDIGLILAALALTLLPGAAVLWASGLRGWYLSASPAVTYGVVSLGITAAEYAHVTWSPLTVAASAAGLAALGALIARVTQRYLHSSVATGSRTCAPPPRRWSDSHAGHCFTVAALGFSASFAVVVQYVMMHGLRNVHQEWDSVFHAGALRVIAERDSVRALDVGAVLQPGLGDTFFYPLGWHGLAALPMQIFGVDPIVGLALGEAIVPAIGVITLAGLARVWTGSALWGAAVAGVAAWPAAYPTDLIFRGPLVPYAVAVGLIPALVVLAIAVTRRHVAGALMLGVAAAGMIVVHPGSSPTAAVVLLLWFSHHAVAQRGRGLVVPVVLFCAAVGAAVAIALPTFVGSLLVVGTATDVDWLSYTDVRGAAYIALFGTNWRADPQYVPLALVLLGFALSARQLLRWWWWWFVPGGVAAVFFIYAAAIDSDLSLALTGLWWNDGFRLNAITWFVLSVAMGGGIVGVTRVIEWSLTRSSKDTWSGARRASWLSAVWAVAFLLAGFGEGLNNARAGEFRWQEEISLSPSEDAAWATVADRLGPTAVIMNDPGDGSPWSFVKRGTDVVFKLQTGAWQEPFLSENERQLYGALDQADSKPQVREALRALGVDYVVLGSPDKWYQIRPPGLRGFGREYLDDTSEVFERQPDIGPLQVWRVNVR